MAIKRGLGKGLSALIPTDNIDIYDELVGNRNTAELKRNKTDIQPPKIQAFASGICEIDLSLIKTNPHQPRKRFEQGALEELAASIRAHGVIQPIVVNKTSDGKFLIIAGERRYRASKLAGRSTIPAVIKEETQKTIKEQALIENIQREDLNPIEIAKGLRELITEYSFTQEKLADQLGMDRSNVANYLRILSLAEEVQAFVEIGDLSLGHAKVLAGIETKKMQSVFAIKAVKEQLSVRRLEEEIKNYNKNIGKKPVTVKTQSKELLDLVRRMEHKFGTKVSVLGDDKKGKIVIEYFTRDDLDRFSDIVG